jgi:hypothetical protein
MLGRGAIPRPNATGGTVKHRLVLMAAATLMAGMLTACGGGDSGDTDAYCDSIKEAKADFESLDKADFSKLEDAFDKIHEIAGDAPDEVSDDWKILDDALQDMQKALADAGLEVSDLEGLSTGQMPEGLDQEDLTKLVQDIQAVGSEEVKKAADNIEKHAKDECDIDLSETS